MKRAHSLLDSEDFDAVDFLSRDPDWKAARRGRLTCLACGAVAVFRHASAKRSPNFAARHAAGCGLVASTWSVFKYLR